VSCCPFCNASIDENLALYGGPCPSCFGEIPGEEAETDPGEDVKQQQLQADFAAARRRSMAPLLVLVPLVVGIVLVAGYVLRGEELEQLDVMVFDVEYGISLDEMAHAEPEPEPEPEPEAGGVAATRVGVPVRAVGSTVPASLSNPGTAGDTLAALSKQADMRVVEHVESTPGMARRTPDPLEAGMGDIEMTTSGSNSNLFSGDLGSGPQRRASLLEDTGQIKEAINNMMATGKRQVVQCYDRERKLQPDLQGQWSLVFTITTAGEIDDPKVVPVGEPHPSLEACVAGKMDRWRLGYRLPKDQAVKYPITLY
jgi:hypothetical protein